jgi:hypothetical protein
LPSPSLGPPLLSASPSPAPGPWGIPELDELDEGGDVDCLAVDDPPPDEFDDDELPPQPANASSKLATSAASAGVDRLMVMVLSWLWSPRGGSRGVTPKDGGFHETFPSAFARAFGR